MRVERFFAEADFGGSGDGVDVLSVELDAGESGVFILPDCGDASGCIVASFGVIGRADTAGAVPVVGC